MVVPIVPPDETDQQSDVAAELRALFQSTGQPEPQFYASVEDTYTPEGNLLSPLMNDLPDLEEQPADLKRSTPVSEQNLNSRSVFTLDDMDDLFIDDDRDPPSPTR